MFAIATQFEEDMKQLGAMIDLTVASFELAKKDGAGFRSRHKVADAARIVRRRAKELALGSAVSFDGLFLNACSYYERAVRDLIDRFTQLVSAKQPDFAKLPSKVAARQWEGGATVLSGAARKSDRFSHLSVETVVRSLASCANNLSGAGAYSLLGEAFSSNDFNFRSDTVKAHLKYLGVAKPMEKIGAVPAIIAYFKVTSSALAATAATERLNSVMSKRNILMHRMHSYTATSESEVRECVGFFGVYIAALATVLSDHLATF